MKVNMNNLLCYYQNDDHSADCDGDNNKIKETEKEKKGNEKIFAEFALADQLLY